MANFINYIIESSVQPTKTNVLWIKNGVPYYFNKKWKPLLGVGSGGGGSSEEIKSPIIFGEGKNSAILQYTNSNALGESSVSLGSDTTTNNIGEAAFGMYNKSILSTDPSKASLFSIGNGTSNVLKNAFEVKYNGDVYIENIDTSIQEYLKQLTLADAKLSSDLNLIINTTISNLRSEIRQIETGLNGKIETNTSLITQTAFEITQEVSNLEVKYDGEFANTKESISKISQKADTIELEVEEVKTTTNGLSTLIEENTASIELNKRNITSKVSRSEFNSATEEINKQYTEVVQTVDSITQTVKAQDGRLTQVETTVDGLTVKTGTLEADIESLKKQSDGSIDTHFGTVVPTLDNEPAVNWVTDEEKIDHTGDIYYNNNTGEAYRFSYDPTSNTYFWVELTDSALTDALSKISKLEEAIDGKVTIFYTEPTNYKYGDLWFVHKDYNSYKEGSIVTSTNIGKDVFKESFTESDWEVKTNYTTIYDLEDKATEINDYIEGAFKDNVLTEAELSNIKELKASFEIAQAELEESYNILYISSVATQENKNLLSNAFNALKTAYNALIDALDNLTAGTVDEYRTAYSEYLEALKNYSKIASEFTESIQSELLKANQYISDIASDNIITPIEKKQLFEIWRQILEEFETNKGIAINYKIIDSEGNQRTDIYTSNDYYLVYKFYKDAYTNLIDKFDVFDLDNLNITTTLPNGYSISAINAALDIYYSALKEFSKLISKITIEITDAHDKALALANSWQEHLDPKDAISVIGKGVILSTVIGVQSEGVLEAVLNASDDLPQAIDSIHGKIIFAGGIGGSENWNDATTLIYEDGYVHFKYGKIDESVQLGSAFLKAVAQSSEIDVLSYPQNGVNVPLLQINKDNTGKIISISSLYDFYVNGNLVAYGDVATSGAGQDTPGSGGSVIGGIMVNGMPYTDDDGDGFITLPDYPKKLSALENDLNLGSFAYKNALAVSDIPDLSGKYLPLSGGVIDGTLMNPLTIKTSAAEVGIPMFVKNSAKMWVGWNSSYGAYIYSSASSKYLGIKDDGTPHYNGNTLIHSGNVGEYALKIDGSNVMGASAYINWATPTGQENYSLYGAGFRLLGYNAATNNYMGGIHVGTRYGWQMVREGSTSTMWVRMNAAGSSDWGAWKTIAFTDSDITGNAATATNADKLDGKHLTDIMNTGFDNTLDLDTLYSTSALIARYWVFANSSNISNQPWGNSAAQVWTLPGNYNLQIAKFYNSNDIRLRGLSSEGWTNWQQLAFTDSNVASATKLATPRTIWGQSFDGTGDVDGHLLLNNATYIRTYLADKETTASLFGMNTINELLIGYGTKTLGATGIYGKEIYFAPNGEQVKMRINSSGNVTIGNQDLAGTSMRLYVNGSGYFTSDTYLANWAYLRSYKTDGSKVTVIGISNKDQMVINAVDSGVNTAILGGNVLIGTTTDNNSGAKLQVNGPTRIYRSGSGSEYIDIRKEDIRAIYDGYDPDGYCHHEFRSNGTATFFINGTNGNVGIGTTSPAYTLDVAGTGRFTGKVSASGGIDIPNGQQLAFLDASGNRHTIAWDSASNGILIDGNLIVLGELATGLPMQEIPSIPEIGV